MRRISSIRSILSRTVLVLLACLVIYQPVTYALLGQHDYNALYGGWEKYVADDGSCGTTDGPADLTVGKNFSLGPLSNGVERRVNLIKALMASFGFLPAQAAGIVGNFMAESGGINLPPNINEGTHTPAPPAFKGGYGWAQWTGGRQVTFIDYVTNPAQGYMASKSDLATDAANYAYLLKELSEGYKSTVTALKNQSTPEDAAVSFEATFERAGKPVLDKRKANARQAYNEYTSGSGEGSSAANATGDSACGTDATADCGDVKSCSQKLLNLRDEGKIVLGAGAEKNLKAMVAGQAITDCNPPGPTFLNVTLLQLLIKLSANFKINIHNFSYPGHSCDYPKFHPRGRASDVHLEGESPIGSALGQGKNKEFAQAVMNALPPGGGLGQQQYIGALQNTAGKRYFPDGDKHFHIDVGASAP